MAALAADLGVLRTLTGRIMGDDGSPNAKCPSCGSRHLLRADSLSTVAMVEGMSVTAKVPLAGRKTLLKKSSVVADVCLDCGVIQFRAADLTKLREASQAGPGVTKVRRL